MINERYTSGDIFTVSILICCGLKLAGQDFKDGSMVWHFEDNEALRNTLDKFRTGELSVPALTLSAVLRSLREEILSARGRRGRAK